MGANVTLDSTIAIKDNDGMAHDKQAQKISIYVPPELLGRIRKNVQQHRRSFNQEVLWLAEQSLEREKGTLKDTQDV